MIRQHRFLNLVGPLLVGALMLGWPLLARPLFAQGAPRAAQQRQAELFAQRDQLWKEAQRLDGKGEVADAIIIAETMLAMERELYGKAHSDLVVTLEWLATRHERGEDFGAAQKARGEVLEMQIQLVGKDHWQTTDSRLAVAHTAKLAGWSADQRRQLAEAESRQNQATEHMYRGDFAKAEPLLQQALQTKKRILGDRDASYASALHNLAALYGETSDFLKSETLRVQVLEINRQALGENHPDTAAAMDQLGMLYRDIRQFDRAEPLLKRALEIAKLAYGQDNTNVARHALNVGSLYIWKKEFTAAEPYLLEALQIHRKKLGHQHPETLKTQSLLALVHESRGDLDKAEAEEREILKTRQEVLPASHPDIAQSFSGLARIAHRRHDFAQAKQWMEQAMELRLGNLELAAGMQTERQQLMMASSSRYALNEYLTLPSVGPPHDEDCYRYLLRWKSLVSTRQQLARATDNPQLKPVVAELQGLSTELARLAFSTPPAEKAQEWRDRIQTLTERKDQLERQLSAESAQLRRTARHPSVADIKSALPDKVALIDFLLYDRNSRGDKPNSPVELAPAVVAFVVVSGRPVVRVDFDANEQLPKTMFQLREAIGSTAKTVAAGQLLRERLWLRLEKHFGGAHTVLISADGFLVGLPWGALPGSKAGTFLLEEYSIGFLPSAQALLTHTEQKRTTGNTRLLLVGGVDYAKQAVPDYVKSSGAEIHRVAVRGTNAEVFAPLPGTRREIDAIERTYAQHVGGQKPTRLEAQWASERTFSYHAPRYGYLHIATHGFFAAPQFHAALSRSAEDARENGFAFGGDQSLAGYNPNLFSGLVLAGANQTDAQVDDGILTAEEVSWLDLRAAELIVLSACETSLGKHMLGHTFVDSEGGLGLQRAFQMAGARTMVTSLWKVDDSATQVLMTEFYRNLWEKKLGKLEALRQAQLAMLRQYDQVGGRLRGLKSVDDQSAPAANSPYLWAAFVLSGDWR